MFELIAPYIVPVIASLVSVYTLWVNRGKRKADIATTLTDTALDLIEQSNKRIDNLEAQLSVEKEAKEMLLDRVSVLERQRNALQKKVNDMEEHSGWRDGELAKAVDRLSMLESIRVTQQQEISNLQEALTRRKEEISSFKANVASLEKVLMEKDVQIRQLLDHIKVVTKERDELKENSE